MKNHFLWILVSIGLHVGAQARADMKGLGLGIILGDPTGISVKKFLESTSSTAIDGAFAWSLGKKSSFTFHSSYLFHNRDLFKSSAAGMAFYYGVGGRIVFHSDDAILGVRVPVGLSYEFKERPIEVFLEVVPIMDLIPSTGFDLGAGIGGRYYF